MNTKPLVTTTAFFLCALLILGSCKKDKQDDTNTDSTIVFNGCATYSQTVNWMDDDYTYSASVKLKDASQTLSGTLRLDVLDSTGNFKETLREEMVTFPVGGSVSFNASGNLASILGTYKPVKYLFRLQFKSASGTTFKPIDGTGCTDPAPFYVQDPLYGTAHGFFINALWDSVPADFVIFDEPVVAGLAGNSASSGYINAPSSNWYWTHYHTGVQQVSINPGDHFTYIQSGFSASPNRTVIPDNLNVPNPAKAYVRFVNLYDYDGMTLKVNGNTISAFEDKDFLEFSGFEEMQPGSKNFSFYMEGLNYTIGTLNGITLQAGKLYTVYHGGNDVPGAGNPKKLTPRIVMHN